jgi:hypothetical protein
MAMRNPERKSLLAVFLSRIGRRSIEESKAPARPFQAISIFRGIHACEMARKFSEHRFLTRDAPPLPLSGCTMAESCECRYIRHKDRRAGARRLMDFGALARAFDGRERRSGAGRRNRTS